MSCQCAGCNQSYGLLGELLGAEILPPLWQGDSFEFGFNISGMILAADYIQPIADSLESEGLTYNTSIQWISGGWKPYIALTGNVVNYWNSGTDFKERLQQFVVAGVGSESFYPDSVQFRSAPKHEFEQ